ncbi:MAG: ABC transporter permease [Thermomicrobiales bacterium]
MSAAIAQGRSSIRVCLATAATEIRRTLAYTIEVIRWPLFPLLYYVSLYFTYEAAGRDSAGSVTPAAFLLVGIFGMTLWSSAIWSGGYAVETERSTGTINSLFLTPASRGAVVIGYSLGAVAVFVAPTMLVATGLALVLGVDFNVADPIAVVVSFASLLIAAIAMSYLLAGAFVLTRKANMFANFLQTPIYLLSGMVVPVGDLPGVLQWFAYAFPVSAGMEALRGTLLSGQTLGMVGDSIVRLLIVSVVLMIVGQFLLERVEHAARNAGTLDFE